MFRKLHVPMSCTANVKGKLMEPCSGRGHCLEDGTCLCEIRYSGHECNEYNISYHASVSSVFYFVATLSMIQLFICCKSEYKRLKQPSLLQAIRITTQKLLYFVVFIAASLRGAYFTTPEGLQPKWVLSAYYPLLLTCSSLVTCSWAEIFHLRNIRATQFLSKSFLGFLAFNILPYSLFGAEILSSHVSSKSDLYASIFSGCYAFLMSIVLIFFLIYGVEVFFKIRGEFLYDCNVYQANFTLKSSRTQNLSQNVKDINVVQVNHARFGLLSQAGIMVVIVVFLASDSFGRFWKSNVDISTRNCFDIIFRLAEVSFALWFNGCLWNCCSPEELWILNPRLLTRQIQTLPISPDEKQEVSAEEGHFFLKSMDCWICYDSDKLESLIQPCKCTGDVSSVHHECLRKWLAESYCKSSEDIMKCKICNQPYEIQRSKRLYWRKGFSVQYTFKSIILVSTICVTAAFAWVIIQIYVDPMIRVLTAGVAILIGYICIKLLGENTVTAYHLAKINSINIINANS